MALIQFNRRPFPDSVEEVGNASPKAPRSKSVSPTQKAIDALPMDSGEWKVEGVPGLYVRCRVNSKSFRLFRRVEGNLVRQTLGEISMKAAKERAMETWSSLRRKRLPGGTTFAQAFARYIEQKQLASATVINYRVNFDRYLPDLHSLTLRDIGEDREGMRSLQQRIRKDHGRARANQVVRLISSVYNWQRKIDPSLPESPTTAVDLDEIKPRDWAYSSQELRAWWHITKEVDGRRTEFGVSTLSPVKRAYWLASLFTGARPRSLEHLKWADVDLNRKIIRFRITKGDQPYVVPISDLLHLVLDSYCRSECTPPTEWVFPSRSKVGHVTNVKNEKQGVSAKYRLRHTFKTSLTALGFTNEQGKLLMGHSLGGDVATGYITAPLLVESLRPVVNAVAKEYLKAIGVYPKVLCCFSD